MKFLLLLALLASPSAFAIQTKDCPKGFVVSMDHLRVTYTLQQIIQNLNYTPGFTLNDVQIEGVKASLKAIPSAGPAFDIYDLRKAASGKCIYQSASSSDTQHKAEIFTSSTGVNRLYFQLPIGPRGILLRTYLKVTSLRPDQVQFDGQPAVLTLAIPRTPYTSYSAGGALTPVGDASQYGLKVRAE